MFRNSSESSSAALLCVLFSSQLSPGHRLRQSGVNFAAERCW